MIRYVDTDDIEETSKAIAWTLMIQMRDNKTMRLEGVKNIVKEGLQSWIDGTTMKLNQAEREMEDD